MDVQLATTDDELIAASRVLLQLRPHYDQASLLAQIKKQQDCAGFRVATVIHDDEVVCVAGFVITEKLAWGKALYVDDLVTDENKRSLGAGHTMIAWLKAYAHEQGCCELRLDSGVQRLDAYRFYDREGFARASLHFSISDL